MKRPDDIYVLLEKISSGSFLNLKEFARLQEYICNLERSAPAFVPDPSDWRYADNLECTNCGRMRLAICKNGKYRCEKCDFSPELNRAVTDTEVDEAYRK